MNWFFFHGKMDNDYAWELDMFHRIRNNDDGFTTAEFKINFDKYRGDHNPKFEFSLILFNFIIFDFEIYNLWHVDQERSPHYEEEHLVAYYHSRKEFYGKDICWYSFKVVDDQGLGGKMEYRYEGDKIPQGFLRVPETGYYEFGGTFEESMKTLLKTFRVEQGKDI